MGTNEQHYCDKCGTLIYDKRQGIDDRHVALIVFGYSGNIKAWGYRENAVNKAYDHLCSECFAQWVDLAALCRAWVRGELKWGQHNVPDLSYDKLPSPRHKESVLRKLPQVSS